MIPGGQIATPGEAASPLAAARAQSAALLGRALEGLSALPYRGRRTGLRLILACLKPLVTGRTNAAASRALSGALALPARDARRFMHARLHHHMTFLVEWMALGRRSVRGLIADSRHLVTDAAEDLRWLAEQRGAIIGTMHFGPYSLGLVWLLHTYFQGRKVIIFKSHQGMGEETRALARLTEIGADVEFVAPDAIGDFHRLIKDVRRGAVVIIMIDLPPTFGRSDPIDLMGHQIAFASGAADLAALSQAPLMLMRIRACAGRDRLEVGDIFDVARQDPASRARAVSRIAGFVGDTLHHYPDQWHMWERFGEYRPTQQGATS